MARLAGTRFAAVAAAEGRRRGTLPEGAVQSVMLVTLRGRLLVDVV